MENASVSPTVSVLVKRYERLLEVTRDLCRITELEPLLLGIVQAAMELTYCQTGSIILYEAETGLLKFASIPSVQQEAIKRIRIPIENSIAGQCFSSAKPVVVQNANLDERVYRSVDRLLNFRTHSLVAVPLIYRNITIGVLEVLNKKGNALFSEEDVQVLETLASPAAVAIQTLHLQQELQNAKQTVQEMENIQANFVAIASHELRTPLGHILGHASILSENIQDPEGRKHTQVILNSGMRLQKIIEDLVNVETVQSGKSRLQGKRFALNRLVEEVLKSFEPRARKKGIVVLTELPDEELEVEGDPEKIAIAISNLIENAIHFTDDKGHMLVTVEKLPGYARFSVVDDGIGIPAKDLDRIFERFYQVEKHMTRRHGGLGLGLAVAKAMVEMHGGQIWAESVEGRGSNFSFLLPSSRTPPRAKAFIE